MDEKRPIIMFDAKANGCPFYVRYEVDGRVKFFDLDGALTQPAAVKMAKEAGFENCEFYRVTA